MFLLDWPIISYLSADYPLYQKRLCAFDSSWSVIA